MGNSSETLLELAIEASSKLPFDIIDHFFESRAQTCPDNLAVKCANSTLPPLDSILALGDDDEDDPECEYESNFKDISQNGFTIFATWMCSRCGCGCVRVQWCQRRITAFDCNCNQQFTFFCRHVKLLILKRIRTQ